MDKVVLTKTEYKKLKKQADAYKKFAEKFFDLAMHDHIEDIVEDFSRTKLYSKHFLKDMESGLRKSSYSKRYGHKTS